MPELTDADRDIITRADEVLAAGHDYDAWSMAERVTALEWHLGEVLRLAKRLGD